MANPERLLNGPADASQQFFQVENRRALLRNRVDSFELARALPVDAHRQRRCVDVLRNVDVASFRQRPQLARERDGNGVRRFEIAALHGDVDGSRQTLIENRVDEAAATLGGKGTIATSCPFCLTMIKDGIGETGRSESMKAKDIAELVAQALP